MQIFALPGIVALRGSVIDNEEHHHHALQLVFVSQSPFALKSGDTLLSSKAAAIAPDTPHQLDAVECLLFLIEPESHLALDLSERWLSERSIVDLGDVLSVQALVAIRDAPLTKETLEEFFSAVTPAISFLRRIEIRIQRVLEWIDKKMATGDCFDISLQGALDIACLSESRFLHLFSQQLEIPWRPYLLWRRLLAAVLHAGAGHSLTESAHFAAFSDSAHFSRTFKSTFGISPAVVIKNSKFIQAP